MTFKFLLIIGLVFSLYFLLTNPSKIRKEKFKNFKRHIDFYIYLFIIIYIIALIITLI